MLPLIQDLGLLGDGVLVAVIFDFQPVQLRRQPDHGDAVFLHPQGYREQNQLGKQCKQDNSQTVMMQKTIAQPQQRRQRDADDLGDGEAGGIFLCYAGTIASIADRHGSCSSKGFPVRNIQHRRRDGQCQHAGVRFTCRRIGIIQPDIHGVARDQLLRDSKGKASTAGGLFLQKFAIYTETHPLAFVLHRHQIKGENKVSPLIVRHREHPFGKVTTGPGIALLGVEQAIIHIGLLSRSGRGVFHNLPQGIFDGIGNYPV